MVSPTPPALPTNLVPNTSTGHTTHSNSIHAYLATLPAAIGSNVLTKRTFTASTTLVAGDADNVLLDAAAASGVTVTVPQDSAASIAQEVAIPWRQSGTGQVTFAAGTGATLVSRGSVFKSAGQYAEGTLTKIAANTWLLSGDISA